MTTILFLVRHGQTSSNITGFYMGQSEEDLTETGYEQVRRLSCRLAGLPIASVYTSPLRRAYATAAVVAEPHQIEPKVLDELVENGLGDWQGLHMDQIGRRWPKLWQQWRSDPSEVAIPNGESLTQVTDRAILAFNNVAETNRGKQAVVVTHEVIVKVLVAHVLGTSNAIYRRFEVDNASLTVIRCEDNKSRIVKLNDTSHL